jgi:hypothetical protein
MRLYAQGVAPFAGMHYLITVIIANYILAYACSLLAFTPILWIMYPS